MRIDLLLSRLCLFKTRSQAARACDEGRVRLNGRSAKPATEVRAGDRIAWSDRFGRREEEVEVIGIPAGSVSRAHAREFFRLVGRRELPGLWEEAPAEDTGPARPGLGADPESGLP